VCVFFFFFIIVYIFLRTHAYIYIYIFVCTSPNVFCPNADFDPYLFLFSTTAVNIYILYLYSKFDWETIDGIGGIGGMNTNTHTRAYKRLISYNVILYNIVYKTRAWNSIDFQRLISIITQYHHAPLIILKFVLRVNEKLTRVKNTYHPYSPVPKKIDYNIVYTKLKYYVMQYVRVPTTAYYYIIYRCDILLQ